uniref:Ig-like domain-containing protein n=1 Tax=Neogobius melanostomus TaxID=47308 RepID=A0A8C6WYX6_9GOBI
METTCSLETLQFITSCTKTIRRQSQKPPKGPAQTLSISCRVSGYSLTDSSYGTGWIRQRQGKLEWIFYQWGASESLKSKFSIDLDTSSKTVTLTGKNMQPGDSAVYYCARAPQSLREYEELNKNN